jgi:hypothetical protein
MRFCKNCGKQVNQEVELCNSCGAAIEGVPLAAAPPSNSQPSASAASTRAKTSSIAALAIAALGAAVMIDLAVETFIGRSSQRWWAVTAAAAYLGSTVATRRKDVSWSSQLTIVLVFALGLAAATAWWPAGLANGIRLVGQPTSRVFSGLTAGALVAAILTILRTTILPLAGRLVVSLPAFYGLAAFGLGAWHKTPYQALFAGESIRHTLPSWLQGGIVGGLVALPLALLVALAGGMARAKRSWQPQSIVLFVSTLAMAFAAFRNGAVAGQPGVRPDLSAAGINALQTSQPARVQPPRTPQNFETQGQPASGMSPDQARTEYQAAIGKLKSSIDYAQIDVGARQAKIGNDPQAISSYVQDRIRYEAYSGALRGARGTLLARAGNSVDRALLQAALLKAAGHRTRFAAGNLTAGQAEGLIRAAFQPPATVDLKPPGGEIGDRAFGHFLLLGDALEDSGLKAPADDAGTWDRTVREAQQHVWVQFEKAGQWIEADSSPGVSFGRALVGPDRVMDALDPNLFDTVEFALEVETIEDGKRATRKVLEQRALTADLAGVVVGFFHEKGSLSATPVLQIGDQTFKGTPFNIPSEGLGGNIASSIGSLFDTSPSPASGVTGEWLNIRTGGPAGERSAKYAIVDTTGQAAREAGQPPADPAIAEKQVSGALDGVLGILVNTGRLPVALLAALIVDMPDPATAQGQALTRALTVQSASYAVVRGSLPSTFLNTQPVAYIDTPNVVISRSQPAELPNAQDSISIDLTLKGYRTVRMPEDPLRADGSFYDHVAAGVIDHTTERWVLGPDLPAESVGSLFETALDQNIAPRVVKDGDRAPLDYLSPDARLRLSTALVRGQFAVVPQARPSVWPAPLGWWNIDPSTGWTEDTTELGGHAAMPERGVKESRFQKAYKAFCRVGRGPFNAAILVIALANPNEGIGTGFWSFEDGVKGVQFVCAGAGDPVKGGPTAGPRVPPAPPLKPQPGFPPARNLPTMPKPKTPNLNKFWRNRGTLHAWR